MKIELSRTKQFVIAALAAWGLILTGNSLWAQPSIYYTVSGTAGAYTLDFTVSNTTPGTGGFDIYYWGVLADGSVSGSPPGYASETFATIHQVEAGDQPGWTFNTFWIDAGYTRLPTGRTLSGFKLRDTDSTPPTSIPFFAFGVNNGVAYTGPDNHNLDNPYSPLFLGYAISTVPRTRDRFDDDRCMLSAAGMSQEMCSKVIG